MEHTDTEDVLKKCLSYALLLLLLLWHVDPLLGNDREIIFLK
jgi:hypothetical protein